MSNYYYLEAIFLISNEDNKEELYKRVEPFKQDITNIFNNNFCPLSIKMSGLLGEKIVFSEEYFELERLKEKELIKKCNKGNIITFYLTNRSKPSSLESFYRDRFDSISKIKEKIKNFSKKYKIQGEFRIKIYKNHRKSFGLFDGHEDNIIDSKKLEEKLH